VSRDPGRIARCAWAVGRVALLVAAGLALTGGLLAGVNRPLSDSVVLGAFAAAVAALPLCALGLPAATAQTDPGTEEIR
jgi:branched-subunit amino acid ABC-type transport system permease component